MSNSSSTVVSWKSFVVEVISARACVCAAWLGLTEGEILETKLFEQMFSHTHTCQRALTNQVIRALEILSKTLYSVVQGEQKICDFASCPFQ